MEYDEKELKKRMAEEYDAALPNRIYFIFDQFDDGNVNVRILDTTKEDEDSEYVHMMCAGLQSVLFEETEYVIDTGQAKLLEEMYEQEVAKEQEEEKKKDSLRKALKKKGNNIVLFDKKKLN